MYCLATMDGITDGWTDGQMLSCQ